VTPYDTDAPQHELTVRRRTIPKLIPIGQESDAAALSLEAELRAHLKEELREHLKEVGVALDLPDRASTRTGRVIEITLPPPDHAAAATPKVSRGRQMIAVCALVCSTAIAVVKLWPAPTLEMPAALLGDWITTVASHRGRYLGFTASTVVMGANDGTAPIAFPVTRLRTRESGETIEIRLNYQIDGVDAELVARLRTSSKPTLTFVRPAGLVWERKQ